MNNNLLRLQRFCTHLLVLVLPFFFFCKLICLFSYTISFQLHNLFSAPQSQKGCSILNFISDYLGGGGGGGGGGGRRCDSSNRIEYSSIPNPFFLRPTYVHGQMIVGGVTLLTVL